MRLAASLTLVIALLAAAPALAQEQSAQAQQQPAPEVPKKAEVPFREDAGLITAEYYLATGKYSQALDVIGGVIQRHPDSADAYTYRGFAFERLGDVKKAEENYKHALEAEPTHLGANRYLAGLYLRRGDLNKAMDILQVIRMTCGDVACEELDELQADINHYRNGQRDVPLSQSHGFVPSDKSFYQDH
jgi:Tfp pilus assembly protein PilF